MMLQKLLFQESSLQSGKLAIESSGICIEVLVSQCATNPIILIFIDNKVKAEQSDTVGTFGRVWKT